LLPQPSVRGQRSRLAADVLADFTVIFCAAWVVSWLQAVISEPEFPSPHPGLFGNSGPRSVLLYGILFTLLGYSERLYQLATIQSAGSERVVLRKCVIWSALMASLFSGRAGSLQIAPIAVFALLTYFLLLARRAVRRWLSAHRKEVRDVRNVLIVGAGVLGRQLADHLEHSPLEKRAVLGFLDEHAPVGGKIRGRVRDLPFLVQTEFIDEVILAGVQRETALQAIWHARKCGTDIKLVPELFGSSQQAPTLEQLGNTPVLTLGRERIPPFGFAFKRIVDILGSAVGLVLSVPLIGLIAAAIRLDSPGPILYKAPRVGFKARRFTCYKFRTMVADADEKKHELLLRNERRGAFFKIQNDPRITRVGRFLRRYSLDELPQLWNVLRGEMSLVGPRPHPLDDFSRYRIQDLKRLQAIPGLTGLWQVTARQDPSFERNLTLDREYIEHWSLAGDFIIIFKTVAAVLQGSGS
jgi:exopolysaccharide biosynthesis polyprenyl glycosylphosphotransferase